MCKGTGRCNLMNSTKKFSFVHIAKCAGSSWIKELQTHLSAKRVFPKYLAGQEYSVYEQKQMFQSDYDLISLKSPRHHVWSQFTECRYDEWGKRVTENTNFPRDGNDTVNFDVWLDHFVQTRHHKGQAIHKLHGTSTDDYRCYHPANFQSRVLTSAQGRSSHVDIGDDGLPIFEPNSTHAIETYWDQDWVAIADFFHESKCLLLYRLSEDITDTVNEYIDSECKCPTPSTSDVHISHHGNGHRSTLRNLPLDTLSKVAALTKIDAHVYKVALLQFLKEIAWLESDIALGRQVLCTEKLEEIEPELSYLGISITKEYNLLKEAQAEEGESDAS